MTRFFAVTFRGLETICADEIGELPRVTIVEEPYRRVCFDMESDPVALLNLHTPDDLFVEVSTIEGVTRHRQSLELIEEATAAMDWGTPIHTVRAVRALPSQPRCSVTASFVGKRNYSSPEIKEHVARSMPRSWEYTDDDQDADLNLRFFIEGETAQVGIRLGQQPLYQREYPRSALPGSLKSPVAAAMIRLASPASGDRLLDPCCGSGTILLEAVRQGIPIIGGDASADALNHARERLQGEQSQLHVWDARALPLDDSSIPCIACNLPWGQQVEIDDDFHDAVCKEFERVLAPGGTLVLLTTRLDHIRFDSLVLSGSIEISLFGKRPSLLRYEG